MLNAIDYYIYGMLLVPTPFNFSYKMIFLIEKIVYIIKVYSLSPKKNSASKILFRNNKF